MQAQTQRIGSGAFQLRALKPKVRDRSASKDYHEGVDLCEIYRHGASL